MLLRYFPGIVCVSKGPKRHQILQMHARSKIIFLAGIVCASACLIILSRQLRSSVPVTLIPATPGPIGTNWTFSLSSGDRPFSLDRENREIVFVIAGGRQQLTNDY